VVSKNILEIIRFKDGCFGRQLKIIISVKTLRFRDIYEYDLDRINGSRYNQKYRGKYPLQTFCLYISKFSNKSVEIIGCKSDRSEQQLTTLKTA